MFRRLAVAIIKPFPDILDHSDQRLVIKQVRNICERNAVFVEGANVARDCTSQYTRS